MSEAKLAPIKSDSVVKSVGRVLEVFELMNDLHSATGETVTLSIRAHGTESFRHTNALCKTSSENLPARNQDSPPQRERTSSRPIT